MEKEIIRIENRNYLKNKIESYIYERLIKDEYEIFKTNPIHLITANRFDVAIKLLYLKLRTLCPEYAKELYLAHIKAFSYGSFRESYNDSKKGEDTFLATFDAIFNAIENEGFDYEKSVLALTANHEIQNGSHRLASSIVQHKDVYFVESDLTLKAYDQDYFFNRGVAKNYLLHAAQCLVEFHPEVRIALIQVKDKEILKKNQSLNTLLFEHEFELTKIGAQNLNAYINQDLFLEEETHFQVVLFIAANYSRDDFTVKANGLISKTQIETKELSEFLFNPNTPLLLNCAISNAFKKLLNNIETNPIKDQLLDPRSVLNQDFDESNETLKFITRDVFRKEQGQKDDVHLIPANYVYLHGSKMLALKNLVLLLSTVEEKEPYKDVFLQIQNFQKHEEKLQLIQQRKFVKAKLSNRTLKKVGNILRKIGLFHFVNRFYRKLG